MRYVIAGAIGCNINRKWHWHFKINLIILHYV
jgi:hypothetical protein